MKINYSKLIIINYIYLLLLEFIFKFFVMKTFDDGIIYIIIFTLPIAVIITLVTNLFKSVKINKIISIIIWIIIWLIFIAETLYNSFYKTICGISGLQYGGQVMDFKSTISKHVISHAHVLIILTIPLIIMIILSIRKKIKHNKFMFKDTVVLLFVSIIFLFSSLELKVGHNESANHLFYDSNELMLSTNKFGLMPGVILDIYKLVTNFEEKVELDDNIIEFTKENDVLYNINNIDFDYLIENETDETIKGMHLYFKNQEPTKQNEMTGIFAGKNLIFITAEGFYPFAVNEELTPTLYKLTNEGIHFNNFYQPLFNCSTSDGEFINTLSILPGVQTCSMTATLGVNVYYSPGNFMKNYGYTTKAFHGWTYDYYNRDKIYPNLGYLYYGYDRYKRGYEYALQGINDAWPTSDIDVVNSSYPLFKDDEKFLAYYMSISGHLEYVFGGGNDMATKNKDVVKNLNATNSIKAYIATQVEFDRSLELLLKYLEEDNLLKDTVIVIVPDHYPYGLTFNDIKGYDQSIKNETFDMYKNNLIIYNSELKHMEVDKYISSLDVLPTIYNMFGFNYDSRLLIGNDIFSEADDLVIFNDKSWITNKGRYNYMKKTFESFTDEFVSQEYIDYINRVVDLKFTMSKLLISKDYYRKVFGD